MKTSKSLLRQQGRSFYWAGQWLSAPQLDQAARLYALCRKIDDLADDATDTQAKAQADRLLASLAEAFRTRQIPSEPSLIEIYHPAVDLLATDPLACQASQDLIAAMRTDLTPVRVTQKVELLQYCYGAAGTVGVMMTHLFDTQHRERALPHAIDLGIAMQMTNIARDVLEDARLDRVYLPMGQDGSGVSPQALTDDTGNARRHAWQGVCELLDTAQDYYESGKQGLGYLPLRPRLAIAVAAEVYQDIGLKILRQGESIYWERRCVVGPVRKSVLTVRALWRLLVRHHSPGQKPGYPHQRQLHDGLFTCLDAAGVSGRGKDG